MRNNPMNARLRAAKHPAFSVLTKTRSLDYGLIRMTLRHGLQQRETISPQARTSAFDFAISKCDRETHYTSERTEIAKR
jgi:hypothetical protein